MRIHAAILAAPTDDFGIAEKGESESIDSQLNISPLNSKNKFDEDALIRSIYSLSPFAQKVKLVLDRPQIISRASESYPQSEHGCQAVQKNS